MKKYQPECLINSRLGNGEYDYVSFGDNEIPASKEELYRVNSSDNDINGIKYSKNHLYEVCLTLSESWGYSKFAKYKDLELLKSYVEKAKNLDINLLINIGPNKDGEFDEVSKELAREMLVF